MGADKALLDLGGEPALSRMLRVLREAGVTRIVTVTRPIDAAFRRAIDLSGVTTAINPEPTRGQTTSIRIGVQNLPSGVDAFLLCPVDMPLFEAADVGALRDAFRARPASASIVVPSVAGRRGHPALFSIRLAGEFRALKDDEPGHLVVRKDAGRVLHVVSENEALAFDLDTPTDLARAKAGFLGQRPNSPSAPRA